MRAQGCSTAEISDYFRISIRTLRDWFKTEGETWEVGRPHSIPEPIRAFMKSAAKRPPSEFGVETTEWTADSLARQAKRRFRTKAGRSTIRNWIHRERLTKRYPRAEPTSPFEDQGRELDL